MGTAKAPEQVLALAQTEKPLMGSSVFDWNDIEGELRER